MIKDPTHDLVLDGATGLSQEEQEELEHYLAEHYPDLWREEDWSDEPGRHYEPLTVARIDNTAPAPAPLATAPATSHLATYYKGGDYRGQWWEPCCHPPAPVAVGPYVIHAAAKTDLRHNNVKGFRNIIPLCGLLPSLPIGTRATIIACDWTDGKAPPRGFREMLTRVVIPALKRNETTLVYCMGSHGRTGTFLAALIALLEPEIRDPIAEVRKRHCDEAVETLAQADYIYSLRGKKKAPKRYQKTLRDGWTPPALSTAPLATTAPAPATTATPPAPVVITQEELDQFEKATLAKERQNTRARRAEWEGRPKGPSAP